MLDYDWPRLHAALNDLPAALVVSGALLALFDQFMRRESLRSAGYWMLVLGWVGTIAAVIAGLQAEEVVAHGGDVHQMFERHETMGLITLGAVTVAALWRVARERKMGPGERSSLMGLTLAAAGLVIATSQIGGDLVYDHALGIETPVLRQAIDARTAGHEHADGAAHEHEDAAGAAGATRDSALPGSNSAAGADTAAGSAPAADHDHAPGTAEHDH